MGKLQATFLFVIKNFDSHDCGRDYLVLLIASNNLTRRGRQGREMRRLSPSLRMPFSAPVLPLL